MSSRSREPYCWWWRSPTFCVKIFALVTSLIVTPKHYRAADKVTKQAWLAILGLGMAAAVLPSSPLHLINFAFAALVFLADVRPPMRCLRQRWGPHRGSILLPAMICWA